MRYVYCLPSLNELGGIVHLCTLLLKNVIILHVVRIFTTAKLYITFPSPLISLANPSNFQELIKKHQENIYWIRFSKLENRRRAKNRKSITRSIVEAFS